MSSRAERGQGTIELAVSMVLLTILFLLLLQVGLVARDQVLVTQAAREGARTAAVDSSPGAAAAAAAQATTLDESRLETSVGPRPDRSGFVRVNARYRTRIFMPGTGRVLLQPELESSASMRVETNGES